MAIIPAQRQFTPLLTNEQLARVEHLRLNSTRRFTNRTRGEHLHGKGGASTDFADYRNYVSGDDIRFVDWNIFSRLHKPYLKIFHQEEELHVAVLLDASSSMRFEGKFEMAKKLAASFGIMGMFANERVSIHCFNQKDKALSFTGPFRNRGSLRVMLKFIEQAQCDGDAPLDKAVDQLLSRHSGRGVLVILSDLMTFGDLRKSFNSLLSHGLETFAVQIMGPTELEPDVSQDLRLVDCENNATLDVSAHGALASIYQEYLEAYQRTMEILVRQRNGRFVRINSKDPFDIVMFDILRRKGWVI